MPNRESDRELVERTLAGDREAFDELVRANFKGLYALLFRLAGNHEDAEDMTQESFAKAYQSLSFYRGEASFFTWVARIGIHLAHDHRRRSGLEPESLDASLLSESLTSGAASAPERVATRKELSVELADALRRLPDSLRTAVSLRLFEQRSYDEVAELTGLREGTVRKQIMRSRKLLLEWLAPLLEEESAPVKCRESRRLLEREFEGRLRVGERFSLEAHLEECATCRSVDHAQRVLLDAIEGAPPAPLDRLDVERSLEAIHARIEDEAPLPSLRPRRRLALVAAVVLAFVLGGLGWVALRAPSNEAERERVATEREPAEPLHSEPQAPAERELAPADTRVAELELQPRAEPEASAPREFASWLESVNPPREDAGATDGEDAIDRALLAERRLEVAGALDAATPLLHESGSAAFADEVDRRLAALVESDWPVERIIVGIARDGLPRGGLEPEHSKTEAPREDREAPLAALALRYLGRRSNRTVLPELARSLKRPGLARSAIAALVEAGPEGRALLAPVVWEAELGEVVLARLEAADERAESERIEWTLAAFRLAEQRRLALRTSTTRRLLSMLASSGTGGARALFELGAHPRLETDELLDALASAPGGSRALSALLAEEHAPVEEAFLLQAVERLHPASALDWVLARLDDGELRPLAIEALARYDDREALLALLRASEDSSVHATEIAAGFDRYASRNPTRVASLAETWLDGGSEPAAASLFPLLIQSRSPGAVPALLEYLNAERIPSGDRELALLAVTELGTSDHREELLAALRELSPRDRTLAVELLVMLRRLCGPELVEELFASAPAEDRERALALLDRCVTEPRRAPLYFQLLRFAHYPLTSDSSDRS